MAPLDNHLEFLKRSLLDMFCPHSIQVAVTPEGKAIFGLLPEDQRWVRIAGFDWPYSAITMVGYHRLTNLERCIEVIKRENIPGNLIETGVWRGGASLYMRVVLGDDPRYVWAADSYQGFDESDCREDERFHNSYFSVSVDEVKANFARYQVSTDKMVFLEGYFKDTLPSLDEQWSLIRLDGDTYQQTTLCLEQLYPQLSPGGFVIIDDYGAVDACETAVRDYVAANSISVKDLQIIDWSGICWRKV